MSNDLRKQIYNNLNLKETDELVEIWQKNDRVEWAEDTFGFIRDILQERLGELPPQNEPILEYVQNPVTDELTGSENLPEFYNPQDVLWLEKWLYRAAIAAIIATGVSSLLALPSLQRTALDFFRGNREWSFAAWLIAILIFAFAVSLQSIILYFPLKALGSILKILMEMEFNSRGTNSKNA